MAWVFDYTNNLITVDTSVMVSEPFVNDGDSYTNISVEVINPNTDLISNTSLYIIADDSSETLIDWAGGDYIINSSASPKYKLVNNGSSFSTEMFSEKGLAMIFTFKYS